MEGKVEAKPEVKAEVKPEVKAEVKEEEKKKVEGMPAEEDKKKEGKKREKKPVKKVEVIPDMAQLDIRVGKIVKVETHEDSKKLYFEEVDIGGGQIRKIASGLRENVPIEQLNNALVVVFCNLKERKLAGYPSYGMVLCAKTPDEKSIELLIPPAGSVAGDKVMAEGFELKPCADINVSKKNNPWTKCQPELKSAADFTINYQGKALKTDKGVIKAKSIVNAVIS